MSDTMIFPKFIESDSEVFGIHCTDAAEDVRSFPKIALTTNA